MRLIDADELKRRIIAFCTAQATTFLSAEGIVTAINHADTMDAVPVVRCEDCEYRYDEISYLCCSHGVCFDCEVPPNFYCAEGKRKENDE